MFPGATKKGGQSIAFPDVCKVPAPPAPFVPVPYPNIAYQKNLRKANAADAAAANGNKRAQKKVKLANKSLKKSMGDEAGTLKGMASSQNKGQVSWAGPSSILISATKCVMLGKTLNHSGLRPSSGQEQKGLPGVSDNHQDFVNR